MPQKLSPLPGLLRLPKARIFFAPFDIATGVPLLGYYDLGNCKKMNYSNKPDLKKVMNNMGGPSTLYDQGAEALNGQVKITGYEFSSLNMAIIYGGTASTFTQAGATVTGEAVAAATTKGQFYHLKQRNVSAVVLTAGSTPLVGPGPAGVNDFEVVDALTGLVHIYEVTATSVLTGALTAAYTSAAITGLDQVSPGTVSTIAGTLLVVGNAARGQNQDLKLFSVLSEPDTGPDYISDDYATWDVTFNVLSDYANGGLNGGTQALPMGYVLDKN